MKTVKQISACTGVSVRTLHHYDAIGLLKPTAVTEAGYRLYDADALRQLYLILIYRDLGFPLREIRAILDAPDFDRDQALQQQIRLLEAQRQNLQDRITMARAIQMTGVDNMDFSKFDCQQTDDYAAQAKTVWGKTDAYREYEIKSKGRSTETSKELGDALMALFATLGTMRGESPDSPAVQQWVAQLQKFITEHYYTCTKPILKSLGQMYAGGGSMTENIDAAGGAGTGAFALAAIEVFCGK